MARIVVIFSLCLAACDVGELPGVTGDGGGSADGMTANVCAEISATPPDGHHNPGLACMAAGCHLPGNTGTGAPAYSYAGTLYKSDKTTPYPGATIIVEMGGAVKKVITANNGNFWMVPGVAGLDPPTNAMTAKTSASGCPTVSQPMVGLLTQGGGDCNKAGCHTPGVGQGAVYLD